MSSPRTMFDIIMGAVMGSLLSIGLLYVLVQYMPQFFATSSSTAQHIVSSSAVADQAVVDGAQGAGITATTREKICEWSDLRKDIRDSVVQVFSHIAEFNWIEPYRAPNQGQSRGTAFFIDIRGMELAADIAESDGYLITNAHVVDQAKAVFIQIPSQGKRQFAVDVIGVSIERDVALLRLKPEELAFLRRGVLPAILHLKLADSDGVRGSEEIMTLGYPLGQQSLKGTTGIVSGRERMNGQYMIQISAPINPGNSGGPSINRCGDVVGVNTSGIREAQNVNYIIPSNEVALFLRQLVQSLQQNSTDNEVVCLRKGTLGLIYSAASDELTAFLGNPLPGGLYITDVCPDSLVSNAGLLPGDMIYEMNGHRIDIFGEMSVDWSEDKVGVIDFISRLMYGDPITLKFYRSGTPHEVVIPFGLSKLPAIRRMYPGYEKIDYEIVGGMVIMPLSLNLLYIMAPSVPELAWYVDIRHGLDPVLIITHIIPDSIVMRSRTLHAGSVITEINGKSVGTLTELRAALRDSLQTGKLTLKTKDNIFAVFPFGQLVGEEERLARNFCYETTEVIRALRTELYERTKRLVGTSALGTSTQVTGLLKEPYGASKEVVSSCP